MKNPPHRFHEVSIHGFVIMIKVHPAGHTFHGLTPFFGIAQYNISALFIEAIYTKLFYIQSSSQFECLLDFIFHRQTMSIPTKTTLYPKTTHGFITRNHILDCSCEQMAIMRQACRKGRAVIKDKGLILRTLLYRFLKDLLCTPKF